MSRDAFVADETRPNLGDRRQMRRYHPWRKEIELRPANRGKGITDALTTVEVAPEVIDLAAELEPLSSAGVPFFERFGALMIRSEFPKWHKHGQFWRYLRGIFGPRLRSGWPQQVRNRLVRKPLIAEEALKDEIVRLARECGFPLCGFTQVDRRFIGDGADELFPYDSAVVLGVEMDTVLLDEMPSPQGALADFEAYIAAGRQVLQLAQRIRALGYRCVARPAFEGAVKYVPHAVNAGLAELGANGLALTPQFGPRQRWCMISVDARLEPDAAADFGLGAYCEACLLCVRGCPGRAISEEKVWWRGVRKHKLDAVRCWPYFMKFDGCSICLKVCPLHRYGYAACMEAYQRDGTILGKPKGIDRFLARRERRRNQEQRQKQAAGTYED